MSILMTNKRNGTLYVGVTNSLLRRTIEHKEKRKESSFTNKHNTNRLVYYELFTGIKRAIEREKELKKWRREWKITLIEKDNHMWRDLFEDMK